MKLDKVIFNTENNKSVSLDLDKIVKGRALFQANSGGGKSYIVRKFLEESNGKIQQIIIDPEGEFPTLREKYDYLLIGKDNADIQIDTRHAALLAKKLMETRADAIIDLYEMSPFERIRFVKVFVDALVNLPKSLWHPCLIVIDEIHTFAPESSKGRSESLEAVASLASRGRKRGYALIGATQKLSKFHKDVAAELNTKFTGRCTLDIDQKRAAQELGMKDHTKLRNLDYEFFVFGPGIDGTIKVKSFPVKTTHEEKEKLINEDKTKVNVSNVKCNEDSNSKSCYAFDIFFTVMAPLSHDVLAITAVDNHRRTHTTFINEGVEFVGESLLDPETTKLFQKKSNQDPGNWLELIREDRRYNIWIDENGLLWEKNNYDTFKQITFADYIKADDSTKNVMNRLHSAFSGLIQSEADRAISVWNSTSIQSQIGESFTHEISNTYSNKLDDPKVINSLHNAEELAIQQLRHD